MVSSRCDERYDDVITGPEPAGPEMSFRFGGSVERTFAISWWQQQALKDSKAMYEASCQSIGNDNSCKH